MTTLWRLVADPIRGATPFWKVAVFYSILGGGVLSVAMQLAGPKEPAALRIFGLVGLSYAGYVTVAAFRCAANGVPPVLARFVRTAAAFSLVMLPFFAYLIVTGRVTFAP
jgi:hypothetical protein